MAAVKLSEISMASAGQISAQAPQPMHRFRSTMMAMVFP